MAAPLLHTLVLRELTSFWNNAPQGTWWPRKPSRIFVVSICPHVPVRIPLVGFPWNLVFVDMVNICRENPYLAKIGQECRALQLQTQVRFMLLTATFVEWQQVEGIVAFAWQSFQYLLYCWQRHLYVKNKMGMHYCFRGKSGYANAPQYYVMRTLSGLLCLEAFCMA